MRIRIQQGGLLQTEEVQGVTGKGSKVARSAHQGYSATAVHHAVRWGGGWSGGGVWPVIAYICQ